MTTVIFHLLPWPAFGAAMLVWGFAAGALLRLIVLAFRRDDPRRHELLAELYAVPRLERPFWVAEQAEIAVFEGLRGRLMARRIKRKREEESPTILVEDPSDAVVLEAAAANLAAVINTKLISHGVDVTGRTLEQMGIETRRRLGLMPEGSPAFKSYSDEYLAKGAERPDS
jgi:hypothetical protein